MIGFYRRRQENSYNRAKDLGVSVPGQWAQATRMAGRGRNTPKEN